MRGLSKLSDGPTQWLFGSDSSSSLDLRIDTNRAGMYWRIFKQKAEITLGYEHAVFGSDEESALRFYFGTSQPPPLFL